MVSEQQLEGAMNYLAETDSQGAELKAAVLRTEHMAKVTESLTFLSSTGNNEERKALARTHADTGIAWNANFDAVKQYEIVRARRERAALTIEIYRTESANRRRAS